MVPLEGFRRSLHALPLFVTPSSGRGRSSSKGGCSEKHPRAPESGGASPCFVPVSRFLVLLTPRDARVFMSTMQAVAVVTGTIVGCFFSPFVLSLRFLHNFILRRLFLRVPTKGGMEHVRHKTHARITTLLSMGMRKRTRDRGTHPIGIDAHRGSLLSKTQRTSVMSSRRGNVAVRA